MVVEIVVPELSALPPERDLDETEGEDDPIGLRITALYFEEGEETEEGEVLAVVSNGLGSVEVLVPASGLITELRCDVDDPADTDDVIAMLETNA